MTVHTRMSAKDVLRKKGPENYPADALAIMRDMTYHAGSKAVVGSASLRSQQYAGDYDLYETVQAEGDTLKGALLRLRLGFQQIVKRIMALPQVYITDIKAGSVEEWRIVPADAIVKDGKPSGFDVAAARDKVEALLKDHIITEHEYEAAMTILTDETGAKRLLEAKDELKFHVVRWSVAEVMANKKVLRDGRTMTLEEAFQTPSVTKLDLIALIQKTRFTDFSCIYEFRYKGTTLNPVKLDVVASLRESILALTMEGNYFKALKRRFALARAENDGKTVLNLTQILNSDLGRLYHIVGDLDTLARLLDEHSRVPLEIVRWEVAQFLARLGQIYTLKDYLRNETNIIADVKRILETPRAELPQALIDLRDHLNTYLQRNSLRVGRDLFGYGGLEGGFLPLFGAAGRFVAPALLNV